MTPPGVGIRSEKLVNLRLDAMERDLSTTIATKSDLQLLRQELTSGIALLRKDLELLSTTVTVRLGSIVVVGLGVLFAALKLTA